MTQILKVMEFGFPIDESFGEHSDIDFVDISKAFVRNNRFCIGTVISIGQDILHITYHYE